MTGTLHEGLGTFMIIYDNVSFFPYIIPFMR